MVKWYTVDIIDAMRTRKECEAILRLSKEGLNNCEISRRLDIPRATVRDIVKRYSSNPGGVAELADALDSDSSEVNPSCEFDSHRRHQYAYILGMYLGDGCISSYPRCDRIRIFLDKKYPEVIARTSLGLKAVFPRNKVGVTDRKTSVEIGCYMNGTSALFPQHGKGKKHLRGIKLKDWQEILVNEFPEQVLLGMLHSDGCYDLNTQNDRNYPRFTFSNKSEGIIDIFTYICDIIGIRYKVYELNRGIKTVSIANRIEVNRIKDMGGIKS